MSREVLELVEKLDKKDLKTQLALQCAPILAGVKISNLLTIKTDMVGMIKELFQNTQITVHILCQTAERTVLLLFRKKELLQLLQEKEVMDAMKVFGYHTQSLGDIFEILCRRYEKYMNDRLAFPHELGLLLGYPVCDVLGFIENQGQNYLYSGYWKVYGDVKKSMRLFHQYNVAKEYYLRLVAAGIEMKQMIS